MEPPTTYLFIPAQILRDTISTADLFSVFVCISIIIILIAISAAIASSENAFFSLSKPQGEEISEGDSLTAKTAAFLIANPKKLLATILIGNTFVNIAVVMVSGLMFNLLFNLEENEMLGFMLEIVFVTFTIVLFGEVMPKIYASQNNMKVSGLLAIPMYYLYKMLAPFVWILVKSTSVIDKRITRKGHILSVHELTHAIDITNESETPREEKIILKSIVNFGSITVKQIMRQRPDIAALDGTLNYRESLDKINTIGYSRMPVFIDNLDNIIGVLHVKDLLPHLGKPEDFKWTGLIRKAYFVPESKKIDNLLKEFQQKRVHIALVVDEFGGCSGLVTMEDILEEIFGEIRDEFDDEEEIFSKVDDNTFLFEAKISVNDMCRHLQIDADVFDEIRNEADTLGGMLLELSEELPHKGDKLTFDKFQFLIEAVDKRRIKRVKVTVLQNEENESN